jgi:hypothetical protein
VGGSTYGDLTVAGWLPGGAGTLSGQAIIDLRVQNPLRQRPLQSIDKTALVKHVSWIVTRRKLVQYFFLDSHMMRPSFSSVWPHTQKS